MQPIFTLGEDSVDRLIILAKGLLRDAAQRMLRKAKCRLQRMLTKEPFPAEGHLTNGQK
jgi:hypothetical protein